MGKNMRHGAWHRPPIRPHGHVPQRFVFARPLIGPWRRRHFKHPREQTLRRALAQQQLAVFTQRNEGDTAGRAVPGYEVRLVDEAGQAVADGEIGELLVRGPSQPEGYWNQRAKSLATFQGEWARTGDKYTRDAEGFYEYCGRTDDMFKVSGNWVSPFEVESALISHPAVLEAAVVPFEDEDGLLKPKAFVILKEGEGRDALFDALKEHVKAKVGAWKYPRQIEFVTELPKTATGKIQRFKLRGEGARG